MRLARFFVAVLVVAGAALAACSGNFGSATAPSGIIPSGPLSGVPASPTPTPNSANAIVTYGESDALQDLPQVAGYGGAIAFPLPSPKPSNFEPVPVGVTVAVVAPTSAPDVNAETAGKRGKRRARPVRGLVYVTLLATRDITLSSYPRIAIDVPRDVVTTYRPGELGLALYNPGEKSEVYRLAVAEQEIASPGPSAAPGARASGSSAPGSPGPSATPSVSPSPGSSPVSGGTVPPAGTPPPGQNGGPPGFGGFGQRGPGAKPGGPTPSPTLPPQRIVFAGTATPLKLVANVPAVFALYALPVSKASPSPSPGPSGSAKPSPAASGASPAPAVSGASPAPSGAGSAAPPSAGPSPGPSGAGVTPV